MPVISQEKAESMEFFEIQVITGRDVSLGPIGDWFMGGLNYQIEHHVSFIEKEWKVDIYARVLL